MYTNTGSLDYAGINLWGALAIILITLCGCTVIVSRMYNIVITDYIPSMMGLKNETYTESAINHIAE